MILLIDRARDSDSKVSSRRSVYISEPLRRIFTPISSIFSLVFLPWILALMLLTRLTNR